MLEHAETIFFSTSAFESPLFIAIVSLFMLIDLSAAAGNVTPVKTPATLPHVPLSAFVIVYVPAVASIDTDKAFTPSTLLAIVLDAEPSKRLLPLNSVVLEIRSISSISWSISSCDVFLSSNVYVSFAFCTQSSRTRCNTL